MRYLILCLFLVSCAKPSINELNRQLKFKNRGRDFLAHQWCVVYHNQGLNSCGQCAHKESISSCAVYPNGYKKGNGYIIHCNDNFCVRAKDKGK